MKTEKMPNCCPKCQAPLPADAPQGLCAKCLLAAAATPTESGQSHGERSAPPPLTTVSAAFPQLEIVELIGHGGMGVVYKARQPKLGRFVALKILPQSLAADAAFAERFNREARVLALLNHPNIVTVYDFGQSGGFFYLLMEYVDGVNLRQAMQAGRFTPQQALLLVPRICEALQFAHDEGILHRDIKPENILLDTRGRVKIADFGIAKLVGEARENVTLTASGLAVGTPNYMAPEQLEHPHDVDQRADIYSLGVVFYEMLTGELPIGRFAPPSEKSGVDPRLDEVVFHALEKEREKRFRTATEVKTRVEAIAASPAAPARGLADRAAPSGPAAETRSACYFNTPDRMRDCFPSAAARIFTCKGELVLDREDLTFISPWRTTLRIPLKNIEDLSVGQFQMWTTPWLVKYARLNFLSVTYRQDGEPQTVNLTPVPPAAASSGQIDQHVGRWFEALRSAIRQCTGTTPHASEPQWLAISAEPAWNRKGLPLTFAACLAWLVTWVLVPQHAVPVTVWLPLFLVSMLLFVGMLWFAAGFLHANRALGRGNLDAVTSDEPPATDPARAGAKPAGSRRSRRAWWLNPSWLAMVAAVVVLPLAFLFWEASLYPLFREKIFGDLFGPRSETRLVLDAVPPQFGPGSHDPRQFGGQRWVFQCLLPPDCLAQVLFVRWTNSLPTVEPGLSAYFKTGHAPVGLDFSISGEPQQSPPNSTTNLVLWNVNLGLGYTVGTLFPAEPSFRLLDTPARITVRSGRQRSIPLLEDPDRSGGQHPAHAGVELRLLLQPLEGPAMRTVPSERELNNCVGGSGLVLSQAETLRLMKRLRTEP